MSMRYNILPSALGSPLDGARAVTGPHTDPVLMPRDEAVLLLMFVAEIEHACMVQYLYAGYSLRWEHPAWTPTLHGQVRGIYKDLAQIAREEMGHLMCVQNLLHTVGAPLHFDRGDGFQASDRHPFHFKLEKLSQASLAKYLIAEMPDAMPANMPEAAWQDLAQIAEIARAANDGDAVGHIGSVFARLIELFSDSENGLRDDDFYSDGGELQATWHDWGYDGSVVEGDDSLRVHVDAMTGATPAELRAQAVATLERLAGQGEGYHPGANSHFERFYRLYERVGALVRDGHDITWPVASNPATTDPGAGGYIAHERTRLWAQLADVRYRALLGYLVHFLQLPGPRYETLCLAKGDRTPRGLLLAWAFDEMRYLQALARKLVQMPLRHPGDALHAGLPLQVPHILVRADRERSRWRAHRDVLLSAWVLLKGHLLATGSVDANDPFLAEMREADERRVAILDALADGKPIPENARPRAFQKVAHILDEAVRGFTINAHGHFWAGINRDEFVSLHPFGEALIGRQPLNRDHLATECSLLPWILDGRQCGKSWRMPRYRPPVVPSRQEYIRQWIARQAPDSLPPGQVGVAKKSAPLPEPPDGDDST